MSLASSPLRIGELHPAVVEALESAGWFPSRSVKVVDAIVDLAEEGYEPNPFATGVLEALMGLRVDPVGVEGMNFENSDPLLIDPVGVGRRHRSEAVEVEGLIHETVFPIGWWLSYSYLYVASSGKVVAFASGLVWMLGHTPEEGLDLAVRATRPLLCIGARAGQRRWPPVLGPE